MRELTAEGETYRQGGNGGVPEATGRPRSIVKSPDVRSVVLRAAGLHLFRDVLDDEIGRTHASLLRSLSNDDNGTDDVLSTYGRLYSLLASESEAQDQFAPCDYWQDHLLRRLLASDSPFSRRAGRGHALNGSLRSAAERDLQVLHDLFRLDGEALAALVRAKVGEDAAPLPFPRPSPRPQPESSTTPELVLALRLASEDDWTSLLDGLETHFASSGAGIFGRFRAFRWVRGNGSGRLEGIAHPDPVRLDELVGYDAERALLLQNTEQFVAGFPANNVLLYGDRGTGKSSTVKALLHRFGDRGLRLLEVSKGLLGDFPYILPLLRGRRERFVMFVDDLSFDEHETAYKDLKALLEGGLEARPENVVVYATSNRRHLVQERFADRMGGDDEIRSQDTHQEKLSLADRFGITLIFSSPNQERFLSIVASLASQRGLSVDAGTLQRRALQWAMYQGGFSGRTARQFVDHLTGELGIAAPR